MDVEVKTEINLPEIKTAPSIQIKYNGQTINISRPKVSFLKVFKKRMLMAGKPDAEFTDIEIMYDYCLHVGVPQEAADQWTVSEMTQLFDIINEGEKKS
jgi:hypothetical protein